MSTWTKMYEALSSLAYEWNDLEYEPDERGRGNDALVLVITEEGHGFIARAGFPRKIEKSNLYEFVLRWADNAPEAINSQCEFESAQQFHSFLESWLGTTNRISDRTQLREILFQREFDNLRDELIAEEQTRLDMREELG